MHMLLICVAVVEPQGAGYIQLQSGGYIQLHAGYTQPEPISESDARRNYRLQTEIYQKGIHIAHDIII